jgi:hypothetical protein
MEEFGVRFQVTNISHFNQFCFLFDEIKKDKDARNFRTSEMWLNLVPDDVKDVFVLLTSQERHE